MVYEQPPLSLGQFALAVGAPRRWVLNALTRLGVARRYDEPLARRLALARFLADAVQMPLPKAFAVARRILAEADYHATWRQETPAGAVTLAVDLPRFFTSYGARLALARNQYDERPRGRRPRRRGSAVGRAKAYGMDLTLLDAALARPPAQRMEQLAENMEFLRALRERAR